MDARPATSALMAQLIRLARPHCVVALLAALAISSGLASLLMIERAATTFRQLQADAWLLVVTADLAVHPHEGSRRCVDCPGQHQASLIEQAQP